MGSQASNQSYHPAVVWSGKRDSNPRPRAWKARALPTELFPLSLKPSLDSAALRLARLSDFLFPSRFRERVALPRRVRSAPAARLRPLRASFNISQYIANSPRCRASRIMYGGEGRIRTSEGVRRQIYSLIPLATREPLPVCLWYVPRRISCAGYFSNQSRWSESNRRPTDYKSVALPTELHRQRAKDGKLFAGYHAVKNQPIWGTGWTRPLRRSIAVQSTKRAFKEEERRALPRLWSAAMH